MPEQKKLVLAATQGTDAGIKVSVHMSLGQMVQAYWGAVEHLEDAAQRGSNAVVDVYGALTDAGQNTGQQGSAQLRGGLVYQRLCLVGKSRS
jgi:hypothetical protein